MFNFGWGEIVLIGIVALIAIGPKELPTVLRTVGQLLGKVRRMANEFQGQFQEALREADIADLKKHAEDVVSDISSYDPMAESRKDIEKSLDFSNSSGEETSGSPTSSAADFNPDAPAEIAGPSSAPAELPAPQVAQSDLPKIDIPLPDAPAPLTEKDFVDAAPQPAAPADSEEPPKQAGGKA